MTPQTLTQALSEKILNGLPGSTAHEAMAASMAGKSEVPPAKPQQAVAAVLLYPAEAHFQLLMVAPVPNQSSLLGSQTSFPSQRWDPERQSLSQAARETLLQQMGIRPEVLLEAGNLTSLYVPDSRTEVHPYLLVACEQPSIQLHADFVSTSHPLPFSSLMQVNTRETMTVPLADGQTVSRPYFNFGGQRIWGPAAMILNEVIALLGPLRVLNHTTDAN